MRVPFPLCRSSSSDHRGFLDIRKDRTVGGICRKCQPPSQQIVHEKARSEVESQETLEYRSRVREAVLGAIWRRGPARSVSARGTVRSAGGAVQVAVGSGVVVAAAASVGVPGGTVEVSPAGATGTIVSAGRPPAAGRPGSLTST